jgi:hypothetical protein
MSSFGWRQWHFLLNIIIPSIVLLLQTLFCPIKKFHTQTGKMAAQLQLIPWSQNETMRREGGGRSDSHNNERGETGKFTATEVLRQCAFALLLKAGWTVGMAFGSGNSKVMKNGGSSVKLIWMRPTMVTLPRKHSETSLQKAVFIDASSCVLYESKGTHKYTLWVKPRATPH